MSRHRFLVSYIQDNQPKTTEIETDVETLSPDQAKAQIEAMYETDPADAITDVQVVGLHRRNHPGVTPGHYQQPEG